MKTSYIAAGTLILVLTAAVWDAGRTPLSYRWLPLLAAGIAAWAVVAEPSARPRMRSGLGPALVGIALVTSYVLNPTHRWVEGAGLIPAHPWPFLPGSADARQGLDAVGVGVAALAIFLLASRVAHRQIPILLGGAIAGGGLLAALALHQRLLPRRHPIFDATGVFPYENHYAAFANLMLPVVLLAAVRFRFRAFHRGAAASPAGVCYLCALLIVLSILMTGSRAGIALMSCSLAGWAWVLWRIRRNYGHVMPSRLRALPYLGPAIVTIALGALALAVRRVWADSAHWGQEWKFRGRIMADTVAVWRDNPWWGTGPGTFASVFPYYKSDLLQHHQVAHAHCEPLQGLAEMGVLGLCLAVLAGVWLWRCARRPAARQGAEWPSFNEVEGPALILALGTLAAHSLVDFPLRMPAIVMVAAAWLGLLAAHGGRGVRGREERHRSDSVDKTPEA